MLFTESIDMQTMNITKELINFFIPDLAAIIKSYLTINDLLITELNLISIEKIKYGVVFFTSNKPNTKYRLETTTTHYVGEVHNSFLRYGQDLIEFKKTRTLFDYYTNNEIETAKKIVKYLKKHNEHSSNTKCIICELSDHRIFDVGNIYSDQNNIMGIDGEPSYSLTWSMTNSKDFTVRPHINMYRDTEMYMEDNGDVKWYYN